MPVIVAAEVIARRSGDVDLLVEVSPQERLGHVGLTTVGVARVADAEQNAERRLVHHGSVDVVRVVVEAAALLEALRTHARHLSLLFGSFSVGVLILPTMIIGTGTCPRGSETGCESEPESTMPSNSAL